MADVNADPNAKGDTSAAGTQVDGTKPADSKPEGTLLTNDDKKPDGDTSLLTDGDKKPEEGDKKPEDGDKSKDDKKPEGAPEKYEFTAPEGVELDQELVTEFSVVAKELNLSQVDAQKLVDIGPKVIAKFAEKQADEWAGIRKGWVDSLKADKEFGGVKLPETLERAKRALNKFGDAELTKLLMPPSKGGTGFGDNHALIKLLAKVDQATAEDTTEDGTGGSVDNRSAAEVLYPNQAKA
jgi:hypothetical protein